MMNRLHGAGPCLPAPTKVVRKLLRMGFAAGVGIAGAKAYAHVSSPVPYMGDGVLQMPGVGDVALAPVLNTFFRKALEHAEVLSSVVAALAAFGGGTLNSSSDLRIPTGDDSVGIETVASFAALFCAVSLFAIYTDIGWLEIHAEAHGNGVRRDASLADLLSSPDAAAWLPDGSVFMASSMAVAMFATLGAQIAREVAPCLLHVGNAYRHSHRPSWSELVVQGLRVSVQEEDAPAAEQARVAAVVLELADRQDGDAGLQGLGQAGAVRFERESESDAR